MNRELLLLRHGKSSWKDPSLEDYDRPLKKRGVAASKKMGRYVVRNDLRPQIIMSSTAVRAEQTATLFCNELGVTRRHIYWLRELYHAHVHTLLEILGNCAVEARVLLIGHNPGMEELLAYLSADPLPRTDDGKVMPTAALARLGMPENWQGLSHGSARLIEVVRPRELSRTGTPVTT